MSQRAAPMLLLFAFTACQRTSVSDSRSAGAAQGDTSSALSATDGGTAVPVQLTIRLDPKSPASFPINKHILDRYPEFVATLTNISNATLVLSTSPLSISVAELDLNGQALAPFSLGDPSFVTDPGQKQDQSLTSLAPGASVDVAFGGVEYSNRLIFGEAPKSIRYKIKDPGTYSAQLAYRYFRKVATGGGKTVAGSKPQPLVSHRGFNGVAISNKVDFVVTAN